MPELIATLDASREQRHIDRKFFAALQGVDLDEGSKQEEKKPVSKMEELRTKVLTGGQSSDPNDVLSLVGANAQSKGFGIGQGLTYSNGDETEWWG